jgi:hypothetical protein
MNAAHDYASRFETDRLPLCRCVLSAEQVIGSLPRADLANEAIRLIEECGYPVTIVEDVPSIYAPYFEIERNQIKTAVASHAQASAHPPPNAGIPTAVVSSTTSSPPGPAKLASKARTALGTVGSAASGFRTLPPRPASHGPPTAVLEVPSNLNKENDANDAGKRKTPATECGNKRARTVKSGNAAKPTDASRVAPEPPPAALPMLPSTLLFDNPMWETLPFDQSLVVVGQNVATIDQGVWHFGRISNLTYGKRKWVEYKDLPFVKSHKKGGGMVPPEISCSFAQERYGRDWVFVREVWLGYLNEIEEGEKVHDDNELDLLAMLGD